MSRARAQERGRNEIMSRRGVDISRINTILNIPSAEPALVPLLPKMLVSDDGPGIFRSVYCPGGRNHA